MSFDLRHRKNHNEINEISEESYELIKTTFEGNSERFVQIGPNKYIERDFYEKYKDEFYNFEVKNDDIWVITLPRSGTTVTQEMIWQIMNNMDLKNEIPLIERYTFLESGTFFSHSFVNELVETNKGDEKKCETIKKLFTPAWQQNIPGPRFFKSHMPLSLLPPELLSSGCKIIYVARNPKDMLVSRYNFKKMYGDQLPKTFELFWNLLEKGLVTPTPFWQHIQEAWQLKDTKNLLFLFYEDLVQKPEETISKTSTFLNKNLSQEQISKLADHLNVDNFKNNPSVNRDYYDYVGNKSSQCNFVRRGKVDGWKDELFSSELAERADAWIQENYRKYGFRFPNIPMI